MTAAARTLGFADGRGDHVVDVGCVNPCKAAAGPTWLSNERIAFTLVSGLSNPNNGESIALYTARIDGRNVRRLSEPTPTAYTRSSTCVQRPITDT